MKKMSTNVQKTINGGCDHYSIASLGNVPYYRRKGLFGKKYVYKRKYSWLCGKCGRVFNTYAYF